MLSVGGSWTMRSFRTWVTSSWEEVTEVAKTLPSGKARGLDGIHPEKLKALDIAGLCWWHMSFAVLRGGLHSLRMGHWRVFTAGSPRTARRGHCSNMGYQVHDYELFGLCINVSRAVFIGSVLSLFSVGIGPLCPIFFLIFMGRISRCSQGQGLMRLGGLRVASLLFTNDLVLLHGQWQ